MSRYVVPLGGFALILTMVFVLIVAVMVRPWAGPDTDWRTHMNLTEDPYANYTRSVQSLVSPEGAAPIGVWTASGCGGKSYKASVSQAATLTLEPVPGLAGAAGSAPCDDPGLVQWVGQGCANCHGLVGAGGPVGLNLLAVTAEDLEKTTRFGPFGMPAFDPLDLTDEHLALINAYLQGSRIANPQLIPTPTPFPTATPVAVAMATPASAPPPDEASGNLLAQGKLIFDETAGDVGCAYCHGDTGGGDATGPGGGAPGIRGTNSSEVRQAVRGVVEMDDVSLDRQETAAVVAYLEYLKQQH